MPGRADELDALIVEIHAAALDPPRWPAVLRRLITFLNADKANLITPGTNLLRATWGGNDDWLDLYERHFAGADPWLNGALQKGLWRSGQVALDDALLDHRVLYQSAFFNEFLRPQGIDRALSACITDGREPGGPIPSALSVFRSLGEEGFGRADVAVFERLMPHMQVAIGTYSRVRELSAARDTLQIALDAVATSAFVLGENARLLFANRSGEQLLSEGAWLRLDAARLGAARNTVGSAEVKRAIERLVTDGICFTKELRAGDSSAVVIGAPITEQHPLATRSPWRALGVVWCLSVRPSPDAIVLAAELYRLTPAEQRLLRLLNDGHELPRIAELLRVKQTTLRTQLRSIFTKTGRRRQSELLMLVNRLALLSSETLLRPRA